MEFFYIIKNKFYQKLDAISLIQLLEKFILKYKSNSLEEYEAKLNKHKDKTGKIKLKVNQPQTLIDVTMF